MPDATELGSPFVDWLKPNFGWLYAQAQSNTTLGDSYGNGAAKSAGRLE